MSVNSKNAKLAFSMGLIWEKDLKNRFLIDAGMGKGCFKNRKWTRSLSLSECCMNTALKRGNHETSKNYEIHVHFITFFFKFIVYKLYFFWHFMTFKLNSFFNLRSYDPKTDAAGRLLKLRNYQVFNCFKSCNFSSGQWSFRVGKIVS